MKKSFLFIASTILMAAGGFLSAADGKSIAPLLWPEAVKLAREGNPELKSARSQAESNLARYKGSFNGVLPSLDLSHSYSESKNDSSDSDRWSAQAAASWDLFNLSQTAGISSARAALESARASLRSTSSDVRLNLFRAFAGLLYTQNSISVSETILGIRSTNTKMVSLRYDSGRESKGNRLRSEAELLQAQMDVAQSQRELRSAQQELNRRIGRDYYEVILATGTLEAKRPAEPDIDKLVATHPLVAQKEAALASARASVSQAKSALWPNLTARYTRSLTGHDEFPARPNWTAGGVLSLPIFGSGPTSSFYSIRESLDLRSAAQADLAAARSQIRSQLESAWSNFLGAIDQLKVQEAFLAAARQRNKEADVRYSSGLMAYEDWERIVTERVNFEKSMIQARRDAALADAAWRQAQGLGLEDDL